MALGAVASAGMDCEANGVGIGRVNLVGDSWHTDPRSSLLGEPCSLEGTFSDCLTEGRMRPETGALCAGA